MTPFEWRLVVEGRTDAAKADWRRTAQLAAWIMTVWSDKAISADELLGDGPVRVSEFATLAEAMEHVRSLPQRR